MLKRPNRQTFTIIANMHVDIMEIINANNNNKNVRWRVCKS